VHEADDPDTFIDLLDADALTGKDGRNIDLLRCMQMRRRRHQHLALV